MKWFLWVIVFELLLPFSPVAQFTDFFSDGNLNGWEGDTIHFIINPEGQLQLNAPEGSSQSRIHTSLSFTESMSWDIYVNLTFAPSTSNQLSIYLGTTESDYTVASGYFLEIGASGDQDAIEFKYLDGGVSQSIASSLPGLVADDPVLIKLKVVKNENGLWECFNTSGAIPELLFSTFHDSISLTEMHTFGLLCKYTNTRRDKFFFDEISISPAYPDTISPVWLNMVVSDDNTLDLTFDEILDPLSAGVATHYNLLPENTSPDEITLNGNELTLSWDQPFVSQQLYSLSISDVMDISGNKILSQSKEFIYVHIDTADRFELLITEIMADPTPLIGLPDAEYLEIFNPSSKVFDLSELQIRIGSGARPLPDSIILPGQYAILTDGDHQTELSAYGRIIVIDNMPSLTNSGTSVSLLNNKDEVIHEFNYSSEWYQDPTKSDGGWSMEMTNPLHICTDMQNWAASTNLSGGTPGFENSRWSLLPDTSGPALISVFPNAPDQIELRFDERLDEILMLNENIYSFHPALDILDVEITHTNTVVLQLGIPMQEAIAYHLYPFEATDCLGNNKSTTDTIVFGLASEATAGDIRIHEILFNPQSGGSRYVEIINASEKFIALSELSIGRITATQTEIFGIDIPQILSPGSMAVITPDRQDILARYEVPRPGLLFESALPAWDEVQDHVAIISKGLIIDSLTYSSSWHHPVIADENGVSLERLSILSSTNNPSNWHSASSLHGFGTPTGANSQMLALADPEPPYSILNRNFSPDDDGFKDFLLIHFEHDSGNDVGSVWVHDLEGREIHQVLTNETLGNSAIIQWDGRDATGDLADMGIYVLCMQLWDANGNVREYRESCALVKR